MAHRNARLTRFGRLLLVQRIIELGWPPAQAQPGWPTAAPDLTAACTPYLMSRLTHTDRGSGVPHSAGVGRRVLEAESERIASSRRRAARVRPSGRAWSTLGQRSST
jgi:hypothetical protein